MTKHITPHWKSLLDQFELDWRLAGLAPKTAKEYVRHLHSFLTLFPEPTAMNAKQYVPGVYWLAVVLISVVGTLITDNLTDNFNVSLITSSVIFAAGLAFVFAAWQSIEHTLSIHSIRTARREGFYWLAILFTFALGTAAGDLVAEKINIGYWKSALVFSGLIAVVTIAHKVFHANAIAAFWAGYILTRPLGASIGDYMSQAKVDGGLGIGTTGTSAVFLGAIGLVVVYMARRETTALQASK